MRDVRSGLLILCLVAFAPGCTLFHRVMTTLGQTPAAPAAPAASATPATQALAQSDAVEPPSWLFNDLACAQSLTTQAPPSLRVLGSQDTIVKHMLGPGDILVISGGSAAGLQPGQRFFVRRNIKTFGARGPDPLHPLSVHTSGWVQVLGVDAAIATATVMHACEGILLDDYLEPFVSPMIAARVTPGTLPQYANMGHVTTGDYAMQNVATGQMIGIDRGSKTGVVLGQRFLVFRDKRSMRNQSREYSQSYVENAQKIPLVEVGEVLVVAVRPDDATVQVTMAKDSVSVGDFIAEIR
jgi:hypothetical protein